MRMRVLHVLVRAGLLGLLCASLSGCLILDVWGNVRSQPSIPGEVDDLTASLEAAATGGNCFSSGEPNHKHIACRYGVDGETITSTAELIWALGQFGILIDPLILQVPSDVINVTATYDTGGGPQPLAVGRASSFQVQPGTRITAEVGTTFLFLDLPGDVIDSLPDDPNQGTDLRFSLSFHRMVPAGSHPPLTIKPMMAGKVVAEHQDYYIPLLPCVTDFADVPGVTIPVSDTPQPLEMALGDLIRSQTAEPCDHVVYNFNAAQPPAGLIFVPMVLR
jgi:hypothetical protein